MFSSRAIAAWRSRSTNTADGAPRDSASMPTPPARASADAGQVDLAAPAGEERRAQGAVLWGEELRISRHEGEGLASRLLQHGAVAQEIRDAELRKTRLARAEEIARAAQLEVGLRDAKAIVRRRHGVDAAARLLGSRSREEDAVALPRSPPHPATKLMQLREAEALGMLDEHHGGVGHVDADLNDRGGDEEVEGTILELAHHALLLGEAEPPVQESHSSLRKDLALEALGHLRGRAEIGNLGLLHQGIHDVDLSAFGDLRA